MQLQSPAPEGSMYSWGWEMITVASPSPGDALHPPQLEAPHLGGLAAVGACFMLVYHGRSTIVWMMH